MSKLKLGDIIVLEDNKDYMVVDKLEDNNNSYVLFANVDDCQDIVIRKETIKNNEVILLGLDSNQEFDYIINKFALKQSNN